MAKNKHLPEAFAVILSLGILSCSGGVSNQSSSGGLVSDNTVGSSAELSGVLMWKGDLSGNGLYANESKLKPANVTPDTFGKVAEHPVDGMILAQPLYVSGLDMGAKGTHDVVIVATEHGSLYAFDAADATSGPLWARHFAVSGAVPAPDNFGGRTTIGGEIAITGTPVIDPSTGALYVVTMLQANGTIEQRLRAVDIRTGADFAGGNVAIQASSPGDGVGSQNGQIAFDPTIQNQRAGLILHDGAVIVAWGSFSDWGVYHGWLMAYDAATLQQRATFLPTPDHQADDPAFGPADHGGGGSVWQAGAIPSVDSAGNIYVVAADGSFNADQNGHNYGDSVLKLRLVGNSFQVVDWFTPANQACLDVADLEIGSGGVTLLPGSARGVTVNKEGRVYLLNLDSLGKYNPAGDTQIPQQFLAGANSCYDGIGSAHAEGTDWNRLYGNPSYWNGNLYLAPSNATLRQYKYSGTLNPTPAAQSPSITGQRGGQTVVSAQGNQDAIVWMYEKSNNGTAVLHAYDATDISRELWNSNMNPRDLMGTGISFGTPIVADGRVITAFDKAVVIYSLLQ
jgi:hypothetical protein